MPDFPRAATPAEVWAYGTRTITALTGTPRTDLVGANEPIYTRLDTVLSTFRSTEFGRIDATISSRSSHAAADIWTVATRTLTGLTGAPRSDLIGVDATFEASTGTRATRIDRLADIEKFDTPTEGTATFLTTDTYPKTVTIALSEIGVIHRVECYVDLTGLVAGESLRVDQYMSIVTPVSYKLYAQETYTGAQTMPMLFIITKPARYGLKIDLYMESAPAANRSFPWQWFRKRVA